MAGMIDQPQQNNPILTASRSRSPERFYGDAWSESCLFGSRARGDAHTESRLRYCRVFLQDAPPY